MKTLKSKKVVRDWQDIADPLVRHKWGLQCGCDHATLRPTVPEYVYVAPDYYSDGGIPTCPECGTAREYYGTQVFM